MVGMVGIGNALARSDVFTEDNVAEAADDRPNAGDEERPGDLLDAPQGLVAVVVGGCGGGGGGGSGVGAGEDGADLVPVLGRRGVGGQKGPDEEGAAEEADAHHGVQRVGEGPRLVRAHGVHDDARVGRDVGAEEDVLHAAHRDQHAE